MNIWTILNGLGTAIVRMFRVNVMSSLQATTLSIALITWWLSRTTYLFALDVKNCLSAYYDHACDSKGYPTCSALDSAYLGMSSTSSNLHKTKQISLFCL